LDKKGANKQKQIIDLDEFESVCSLWQLVPSGSGASLKKLKLIVNSLLNGKIEKESPKPTSVLISGKYGKRIHARCFLRALGIENIREAPASVLQNLIYLDEYLFGSNPDSGYIISNAQIVKESLFKNLYTILREGLLYRYNFATYQKQSFPVMGTFVMTTLNPKYIPWDLRECFTYHIEIEEYDQIQAELICLQRLLYSNINRESDQVIKELVSLRKTLPSVLLLLKSSVMVMLSEGRQELTVDDVRNASRFK